MLFGSLFFIIFQLSRNQCRVQMFSFGAHRRRISRPQIAELEEYNEAKHTWVHDELCYTWNFLSPKGRWSFLKGRDQMVSEGGLTALHLGRLNVMQPRFHPSFELKPRDQRAKFSYGSRLYQIQISPFDDFTHELEKLELLSMPDFNIVERFADDKDKRFYTPPRTPFGFFAIIAEAMFLFLQFLQLIGKAALI